MCGLAYDALGRRIKKVGSIAGTTNIYYYDDNWSATGGCLRTGPEMKPVCLFLRIVLVSLMLAPAWASAEDVLPKISFEQTVCDLGQVGLGTKNSCEFKFKNTGQGPLKITNVKSTCGCTVAQLEKKEYAPGESASAQFASSSWQFVVQSLGAFVSSCRVTRSFRSIFCIFSRYRMGTGRSCRPWAVPA